MAERRETVTGGTAGDGAETSLDVLDAGRLGAELGERATLVQFSTAFCQPCRATRRVLDDVAALVPGVRHVEIDAEAHLGLVRAVGVERTPTVLILDGRGRVALRATGAPRKADVLAGLAQAL
ncbi:thioredoxin family protein [Streptomyces sp. CHA1]|uniref:thioredoxin family protein n=1 Tax=unclassified Streptomyces TaxID=2593676 RepID=UPI001BFC1954|nr:MULTISPECIES: thioredoxin family protein [unclassified Streptomyces]MBT3156766.1 thioredoxin family protein [Streptomyces sp. G11C]MCO6699164.1 thioredoxin family protein [Streptomyces sp. CHB9.2]MCO6705456.1 thioredoxin family protein [Streptomyces sp. CHA3]MCO6711222.1 thioredoxin family protein [Streptomyces sp. CHB19.2]MCO6717399.1 thioredoxin family protein [Streptomyces sp. Vc714c-19]